MSSSVAVASASSSHNNSSNPPSPPPMASPHLHLLLPRRTLPLLPFALGLGISSLTFSRRRPLLCDGATPLTTASESFNRTYTRDAKVPVWRDGRVNPGAYRQISSGSVLGGWGFFLSGFFFFFWRSEGRGREDGLVCEAER